MLKLKLGGGQTRRMNMKVIGAMIRDGHGAAVDLLPDAALLWCLARCCSPVESFPMLSCCGFLPDVVLRCNAERQWLLARCCAVVASCPDCPALCWLLARCCSILVLLWLLWHLSSNVLYVNGKGWRMSKFRKC